MKFLLMGRHRGKTERIIKWLKAGEQSGNFPFWNRVMVVFGEAERERLIAQYELNPRQVFTWDNWRNAAGIDRSVEVAIDNADLILSYIVRGHPIAFISMTKRPDDEVVTTVS